MKQENSSEATQSLGIMLPGFALAGLGLFFLLNNLNIVTIQDLGRWWPLSLIVIGFAKLLYPASRALGR